VLCLFVCRGSILLLNSSRQRHIILWNFTSDLQLFAHIAYIRPYGLGIPWRRCDSLCTSCFVDDVIFAHNGPHGGMSIQLQRVTSLHRRAQTVLLFDIVLKGDVDSSNQQLGRRLRLNESQQACHGPQNVVESR